MPDRVEYTYGTVREFLPEVAWPIVENAGATPDYPAIRATAPDGYVAVVPYPPDTPFRVLDITAFEAALRKAADDMLDQSRRTDMEDRQLEEDEGRGELEI